MHRIQRLVDTLDVVWNCFAGNLRICDERVVAEVVGTDPDSVDCFVGGDVEEFFAGWWDAVFAVGEESRDFVLQYGGKGGVDGGVCARADLVRADCTADGVVVAVGVCLVRDIVAPVVASGGGLVVLFSIELVDGVFFSLFLLDGGPYDWLHPSWRRCLALVFGDPVQPRIIRVTVPKCDQTFQVSGAPFLC